MVDAEIIYPIELFYDGACQICSREIAQYQKREDDGRVIYIDISAKTFDASKYGKSQSQFMGKMHVRDANGAFFVGIDAFVVILRTFPDAPHLRLFGEIINLPIINLFAKSYYSLFSRIRPLLPRRNIDHCSDDSCNLNHSK